MLVHKRYGRQFILDYICRSSLVGPEAIPKREA